MQAAPKIIGFLTPSQAFLGSLLLLIGGGTVLLKLPASHAPGVEVSWLDALFTATSALCVTGLTVLNTGADFSRFGTTVILLLFQVGGLGMLLWSTSMIVLLGGELGLRHRLLVKDQLPGASLSGAASLTRNILLFVLGVEILGALVLWLWWWPLVPGSEGLYYAFFHSVSAFCNAGFDLWGDSLHRFKADPVTNLVVMGLIIAGGLGYAVFRDVTEKLRGRQPRISVHSRLVIACSAVLILGGALLILVFESSHDGVLVGRPWLERLLVSFFQSTTRTAGLSTVPTGELHQETLELLTVLMFIGGSPGSTAGGVKTTTFAVLLLAAWSQVRGSDDVEAFERRLPNSLVLQALALTCIAMAVVLGLALVLNYLEPKPFIEVLFETVSALAIVGLSTGITPELSPVSKVLLCLAMIAGRVGPLALAMSLLRSRRSVSIRRPVEDVLIG